MQTKHGDVTIKAAPYGLRRVCWLHIGKVYQIETQREFFSLAKVISKRRGCVQIEFFGKSRIKGLRRASTPLFRDLQPTRQIEEFPIKTIVAAQEMLQ